MSDQAPRVRLTGWNLAAVGIVGMICLTALGLMALSQGVDGVLLAGVATGIGGIVAGLGGFIIGRK